MNVLGRDLWSPEPKEGCSHLFRAENRQFQGGLEVCACPVAVYWEVILVTRLLGHAHFHLPASDTTYLLTLTPTVAAPIYEQLIPT